MTTTDEWIDGAEPEFGRYSEALEPMKIIRPRIAAVVHERAIGRGGRQHGIADFEALGAALRSQYEALHEEGAGIHTAAARLAHEIMTRRPFHDGNARTALVLSATMLRDNGATIGLDPADGADMMRAIARGEVTTTDTANWMYSGRADEPAMSATV